MNLVLFKILFFAWLQTISGYSLGNYDLKDYSYETLSVNYDSLKIDFNSEEEFSDNEVKHPFFFTKKNVFTKADNYRTITSSSNKVIAHLSLLNIDIPPPNKY